jgi:hypothetical protein
VGTQHPERLPYYCKVFLRLGPESVYLDELVVYPPGIDELVVACATFLLGPADLSECDEGGSQGVGMAVRDWHDCFAWRDGCLVDLVSDGGLCLLVGI